MVRRITNRTSESGYELQPCEEMAKEYIADIEEEVELNGETVTQIVGQIVRAAPNDGSGPTYCRLQYDDGRSYKWSGNYAEVDINTAEDDPKWILE